ncbi:peptidase inhibitor family I36 protein [Streptomyces sp. NPDC052164]|uniref:peptidase inhibitor family I36 protein n=1 Tax=Streptomyces sp. NPDC052164 TaxID=3155529 RepID=UPI0034412206
MSWKSRAASGMAVFALMTGAMGATASSASAAATVGGCPSGKLCLYEGINYDFLSVTSTSTQVCIYLSDYGTRFHDGIGSYVNNLPVNAAVYHRSGSSFVLDGTIRPGGFSSNSYNLVFGEEGAVCMGGVRP